MQIGDIVFWCDPDWSTTRWHKIRHVGIYIGEYNGVKWDIESTGTLALPASGVLIRPLWSKEGYYIAYIARPPYTDANAWLHDSGSDAESAAAQTVEDEQVSI